MAKIGISPAVNLHWHKKNSSDLANGYRLYVFENETTTPRECYSNYQGTAVHEHPIIIQPNGKVPGQGLYFLYEEDETLDPIAYTLVLHDETGALVDTVDGVVAGGGGGAGVSVQSDWEETESDSAAYILNKPEVITEDERAKLVNVPDDTNAELALKINLSEKGVPNGVATLNPNGKVPESQLNGVVAEVQEAYIVGSTPFASDWLSDAAGGTALTPNDSIIYYILTTGEYENKQYRWGGSTYIELSASLVLGETSSTAYRGDRGKEAYDHSNDVTTNPHNITTTTLGLENVDNTSDADKPLSNAAVTEFENYVDKTSDQVINGTKTFSEAPTLSEGANFNSYKLPNGDVTPGEGQVLRFPETGNILEWGDAAAGGETIAASGWALSASLTQPTQGVAWGVNETISRDAGLIDNDYDTDDAFDDDTGIFTAPVDGYYYVQCQASAKSPFTGTSTENASIAMSTYFKLNNIGYFNASQNYRSYLNRSLSTNSAGIIYLTEGSTIEAILDCNMQMSFTPSNYTTAAQIFKCSVSFHKIAGQGKQGIPGEKGDAGQGAIGTPDYVAKYGDDGVATDGTLKNDDYRNFNQASSTIVNPGENNDESSGNVVLSTYSTVEGSKNVSLGFSHSIEGEDCVILGPSNRIVDGARETIIGYTNDSNNCVDSNIVGYNNENTGGDTDNIFGSYNNMESDTTDSHRNIFGENNDIPSGMTNCNYFGKYFGIPYPSTEWPSEEMGFGNYFGGQFARSIFMGRWADRNGFYPSGNTSEIWGLSSVKSDDSVTSGNAEGGQLIWRRMVEEAPLEVGVPYTRQNGEWVALSSVVGDVVEISTTITSADQDASFDVSLSNLLENNKVSVQLQSPTGKVIQCGTTISATTIDLTFVSALVGTYTLTIKGKDLA